MAWRVSLPHTSSQKLTTICKMTVTNTYMLHQSKKHAEMSSVLWINDSARNSECYSWAVTFLCHGNPPLETITDTKHERKNWHKQKQKHCNLLWPYPVSSWCDCSAKFFEPQTHPWSWPWSGTKSARLPSQDCGNKIRNYRKNNSQQEWV